MLSPQSQLPEPTVVPVPSHARPWLQGHPTLPVLFRSGCSFLISLAALHSAFIDISPPSWLPPLLFAGCLSPPMSAVSGGGSTEVQTRTPGCRLEPPCPLLSHKPEPCGLRTLPETALHPHSHPARPSPWHLSLTPWLPSLPIPPLQSDFHTPARVRSANHNSDPVAPLLKSFRKYFICLRE